MQTNERIYVAGHRGMVGSAIERRLRNAGYSNIITRTHAELDLIQQADVNDFFRRNPIDYVVVAAARVGGILYNNDYMADFLYDNMMIAANVVRAASQNGVKKLCLLGSACIYPRLAPQPMKEEYLLTGPLEPTNEGYAIAKIAGLKLCEYYQRQYGKRFISVMPTNLYGFGDNFHPTHSHVIPGMMRRFHEAKVRADATVTVWGSGKPNREFLNVDDLADAVLTAMLKYEEPTTINIGTSEEVTIGELAHLMKETVGYRGEIRFDASKPDGVPRKVLDASRMRALGWEPRIRLRDGLRDTYRWALENGVFDKKQP